MNIHSAENKTRENTASAGLHFIVFIVNIKCA